MADDYFVATGYNGLDVGGVAPVDDVFFGEQVGGGDTYGTQFVEGDNREPKFVPPFENEHDHIAVAYSQRLEIGGGFIAFAFDVGKCEINSFTLIVGPKQGFFIGGNARPFVNYVVPEIEAVGNFNFEILHEIFLRGERCLI